MYRKEYLYLRLAFLLAVLFFGSVANASAQDIHVTYTPPFATVVSPGPFSRFQTAQSFVMGIAPQTSVNIFVTNFGVSTDNLTIKTFFTGSAAVADYSNNTAQWAPLTTYVSGVGSGAASQALSIVAGSTTTLFTTITNSAQINIQLSLASNSADNLQVVAVFTPNGVLGQTQVQGVGPINSPPVGNPVYVGCVGDAAIGNTAAGIFVPLPCDNTFASGGGLLLGHEVSASQGQTLGTWQRCMWGGNGVCDPLSVMLSAPNATGTVEALGISNGNATQGSLLVTQGGQFISHTATYTTNTTQTLQNFNQGTAGIMLGCSVIVNVAGPVTGTSPSLSVIFQDSDGTSGIFEDRISFNAFTTTGIQRAVIWAAPNTGIIPYVPSSGSLTAGTIINGPVLPTTRALITVSGTTPSFGNVSIFQNCW